MKGPTILTAPTKPLELGCRRGADVWYFDRYVVDSGPPSIYSELTKVARTSVDIWDRYFIDSDHEILCSIAPGITVRHLFYGSSHAEKRERYRQQIAVANRLYPHLSFTAQYCCSDEGLGFHDRFLIVDHTQVYSVGASLRSHYRDESSTGLIALSQGADRSLVTTMFEEYWQRAKVP